MTAASFRPFTDARFLFQLLKPPLLACWSSPLDAIIIEGWKLISRSVTLADRNLKDVRLDKHFGNVAILCVSDGGGGGEMSWAAFWSTIAGF